MPPQPRPPISGQAYKPLVVLPAAEEKNLKDKVLQKVAANMGIAVSAVPKDVQDVVDEQVKQSLTTNIQDLAREFVTQQVKGTLTQQVDVMSILDERLKGALQGIQHVGHNSPETQKIMDENARLLKMKFDSLVAAGFSTDQAFQIVITELSKPRR